MVSRRLIEPVPALSLYSGAQLRFDLSKGFPLVTTKKVHLKSIIHELIWFLSGDTNIKYLKDNNVSIWNEWADENGDLGPVYGHQWRHWPGELITLRDYEPKPENSTLIMTDYDEAYMTYQKDIDQISNVIDQIKTSPDSRRLIVSAWNVADINQMALPPCHTLFQFYVANGKLSCNLTQRSCDLFLGGPFNIASFSLLTMMIAQVCDLQPR